MANDSVTVTYPAISIVIPMYNTEKYVGACLTSILNQTFQNFEVIVVDDCSTDNSCAVVESFIPKFGGRLKLYHSEVNSGPAVPTNKGVNLSRGKYLFLMDSDDLIVNNALEILYRYAEDYDADLISMDFGFRFSRNSDKLTPKREDVDVQGWHQPPFVSKPTFESNDLAERVRRICAVKIGWIAWQKFVRRDLLMENDIVFPKIRTSQDITWMIEVFLFAKKVLVIPEPLYIYRTNPTSNTLIERTTEERLHFFLDANIQGLYFIETFLNKHKFFRQNPKYRWDILNFFERVHFNFVSEKIFNIQPYQLYNMFIEKFTEIFGEYGSLIAYLSASSNFSQLYLKQLTQRSVQLENQLSKFQNKK